MGGSQKPKVWLMVKNKAPMIVAILGALFCGSLGEFAAAQPRLIAKLPPAESPITINLLLTPSYSSKKGIANLHVYPSLRATLD
ncbi:hypothetical protein [Paenibacillus sp. NPDC057934]|uniref:hypothetical protein n=1 Tax=Paenibacillus sp. NPDC057934 TaxID=3346282 RepID=UPI0036DA83F9